MCCYEREWYLSELLRSLRQLQRPTATVSKRHGMWEYCLQYTQSLSTEIRFMIAQSFSMQASTARIASAPDCRALTQLHPVAKNQKRAQEVATVNLCRTANSIRISKIHQLVGHSPIDSLTTLSLLLLSMNRPMTGDKTMADACRLNAYTDIGSKVPG